MSFQDQPVIQILDNGGELVADGTDSTLTVSAALQLELIGTLEGSNTIEAVNGIATFTDLSLNGTFPAPEGITVVSRVGVPDKILQFSAPGGLEIISDPPFALLSAPGAPEGIVIEPPLDTSFRITWTVPYRGGVNPIKFVVFVELDGSGVYVVSEVVTFQLAASANFASTTQCGYTLPGLTQGVAYRVKLQAINKIGESPLSTASKSVTTVALVSKVGFGVTLALDFEKWERKRPMVVAALAKELETSANLIEIMHAHSGSTVLQIEVAAADKAAMCRKVNRLYTIQSLANSSIVAVTAPVNLSASGIKIDSISPNIGVSHQPIVVTLRGDGFQTNSQCNIGGSVTPVHYVSELQVLCTVHQLLMSYERTTKTLVTIVGGQNAKPFTTHSPFMTQNVTPASGKAVGGAAGDIYGTDGIVLITGGEVLRDVLNSQPDISLMVTFETNIIQHIIHALV